MKSLLWSLCCLVACTSQAGGGGGDDVGPVADDCFSDSCVCPGASSCNHACRAGGPPCHVQCSPGQSCDVTCEASEECHVEASQASGLTVDCDGTFECHVTCPASGCTVTNCVGAGCVVSCGLTGVATHSGSTATCP